MTKKKKFIWIAAFVFAMLLSFGLVACTHSGTSSPETGSEVGEYYYETESGEEYLLSLNEDGSVSFSSVRSAMKRSRSRLGRTARTISS